MKKKSARDIPDFSRHPTQMAAGHHGVQPVQQQAAKPAHQASPPTVKPHATSAKSGRRGQ